MREVNAEKIKKYKDATSRTITLDSALKSDLLLCVKEK
jgi:hypothetical protein